MINTREFYFRDNVSDDEDEKIIHEEDKMN